MRVCECDKKPHRQFLNVKAVKVMMRIEKKLPRHKNEKQFKTLK